MPTRGRLEALAVDDRRSRLIVLSLRNPHLLECGERGQDGTTDPHGVLAFRGSHDLDLHGRGGESSELLGHALSNAWEHGCSTRHDDIGVEISSDINIAFHDRLEGAVVDARSLLADQGWLEENLWAPEALVANDNNVSVGKLVRLLEGRRLSGSLHLRVVVKCNVGELLFYVAYNFSLGRGCECVASLGQYLHQIISEIAARQIQSHDGVGESISCR